MALSFEDLGMTKEEMQERVIEQLCDQLLSSVVCDDEDGERSVNSRFRAKLDTAIQQRIDDAINSMADKYVLPHVTANLEHYVIQTTNQWGEKRAEPVTFTEYLVQRADAYMSEKVNYEGKPKGTDSYSWTGTQTRITHLVEKHLHYSIETAMKNALSVATSSIATGLAETCKTKLKEITDGLQVAVKFK